MLEAAMKTPPTTAWGITHGMFAMAAATPRAYLAAALAYNLRDGIAEAISCPTLVCEAEGDIFFKGQPQQLYDHLTCQNADAILQKRGRGGSLPGGGWAACIRKDVRLA